MRNAELKWEVEAHDTCRDIPHSEFRIPHLARR